MKLSTPLLAVSLAANLALFAALLITPSGSLPPTPPFSTTGTNPPAAPNEASRAAAPATGTKAEPTAKFWARLSTEDLPSLIARLRAAGFPNSLLRSIVNQRFELRREELTLDGLDRPYWKNSAETPPDPKLAAALDQLEHERTDTLKQLFSGDDPTADETDEARVTRSRIFGNLSSEKIAAVIARMKQVFDSARGAAPIAGQEPADPSRQLHTELAGLLTPEELLEFELRNSATSYRLRAALTGLNSSEAEYRALFSLYQARDLPFSTNPNSRDPSVAAARAAADQQMQAQIKTLLGPDRYTDYLQSSRPEYQQLNTLVTRLELPLSAAAQVASVQQEIQQRANATRGDASLSAADRTARLAALAQEAAGKITTVIGARGLEGYQQSGGQWLATLATRPAAVPKN